jgi:hypothetical protein
MTGSGGLTGTWLNPSRANPARTLASSPRLSTTGDDSEGSAVEGKSAAEPAPSQGRIVHPKVAQFRKEWLREFLAPRAPFTHGDAL